MGMAMDEMMQNDQGLPSCKVLPGLSPGQSRLCQLYIDHMNAVALGAKQAINECKYQFQNRRWNCSILGDINVFGPVFTIGKRKPCILEKIQSFPVTNRVLERTESIFMH
ncbi:hypothetical protein YQE_05394, partial [Dendroctonus ponderosae]